MSEAQPTPERLVLDNETWGHRDLAEVIASRYFILGDDEMGFASWRVMGLNGKDESDCLVELNEHLAPLGMIGVMDLGNPPVLSISELPSRVPVLPKWQQSAVWLAMFSFMTMAGVGLISRNSPETAFGFGALSQAALTFSLPLIGAVALSSEVRKLVAKRHGVRLRGLFPLGFPLADAVWPFGLAGLLPQNRPDQVPYPNRRALAHIEISAPLVTFFCGVFLSIVGLSLTSSSPPGLNSSPLVISANPILEIISNSWLGEDLDVRLQWLHPTGVAGLGLCVVSWIMLMPIPGFPGDHLMHAILGPDRVLAEENQTYIFAITLVIMVLVFSSETWVPWLFLAALATWRRFSPNPILDPFVVDEHSGLDDLSRNRIVAAMMVMLMLAFPGINGAYHLSDWDEGLSTESWPSFVTFQDGESQIELILEPEGVLPVSGWLQVRIEGPNSFFQIDSDCFEQGGSQMVHTNNSLSEYSTGVCRFDEASRLSPGKVNITLKQESSTNLELQTFRLVILVDVANHVSEHSIVFSPSETTSTVDPLWVILEDTETPRICTKLRVVDGDYVNLTMSSPFWYFENDTSLGPGTHDLCLRGYEGAMQSLPRPSPIYQTGPEIILSRENLSDSHLAMSIEGSYPSLHISDGEWKIPISSLEPIVSGMQGESLTLSYVDSGPIFCPSTDVIPELNSTVDWVRELADRSSIRLPSGAFSQSPSEIGNISLRFGDTGWLLACSGTTVQSIWELTNGPDVLVSGHGLTFSLDQTLGHDVFNLESRENYSIPILLEITGDANIWLDMPPSDFSELGAFDSVSIELPSTSGCCMSSWATVDLEGITLHFAARSPEVSS